MAKNKKTLVQASAARFVEEPRSDGRRLADSLNAETHQNLWVSGQSPRWDTKPRHLSDILDNNGDVKGPGIFLPLYLMLWDGKGRCGFANLREEDGPTLIQEGDHFRLAGPALAEFQGVQKKLAALGIIKQESDARLVIGNVGKGGDEAFRYFANVGIAARDVNLDRLTELRGHMAMAGKIRALMDHVFGLADADVKLVAPAARNGRLAIRYSGLSPAEFSGIVETSGFGQWAAEPIEARAGVYTDLPRGFPRILAEVVQFVTPSLEPCGPPQTKQAELILDGEDPDLYRKLLKMSVLKDMIALAEADPSCAQLLAPKLSAIAAGEKPPASPGPAIAQKLLPSG